MITCSRVIGWDMGHRLLRHEGKCRHFHGHRYRAVLEAEPLSGVLDEVGRVVDFSVLKSRIGGWIDERWDHGFCLEERDSLCRLWHGDPAEAVLAGHKLFELPYAPSAENLAHYLLHYVGPQVLDGTGVRLVEVVLWETPNCAARARLDADDREFMDHVERLSAAAAKRVPHGLGDRLLS